MAGAIRPTVAEVNVAEWLFVLLVACVVIPGWLVACWLGWMWVANAILERSDRFWPGVALIPIAVAVALLGAFVLFGLAGIAID